MEPWWWDGYEIWTWEVCYRWHAGQWHVDYWVRTPAETSSDDEFWVETRYSCVVCAFLHGHECLDKSHSHGVAWYFPLVQSVSCISSIFQALAAALALEPPWTLVASLWQLVWLRPLQFNHLNETTPSHHNFKIPVDAIRNFKTTRKGKCKTKAPQEGIPMAKEEGITQPRLHAKDLITKYIAFDSIAPQSINRTVSKKKRFQEIQQLPRKFHQDAACCRQSATPLAPLTHGVSELEFPKKHVVLCMLFIIFFSKHVCLWHVLTCLSLTCFALTCVCVCVCVCLCLCVCVCQARVG